jgi:hypothetical protein
MTHVAEEGLEAHLVGHQAGTGAAKAGPMMM